MENMDERIAVRILPACRPSSRAKSDLYQSGQDSKTDRTHHAHEDGPITRLLLTLAYNGSAWHGSKFRKGPIRLPQSRGSGKRPLLHYMGKKPGFMARAAPMPASMPMPRRRIAMCRICCVITRLAINAKLPPDIRIFESRRSCARFFMPRKDALSKTYIYNFWREPTFTSSAMAPLCLELRAAGPWQDAGRRWNFCRQKRIFASFQNSGTDITDTVRRINFIRLEEKAQ